MDFSELFDKAVTAFLEMVRDGGFNLHSEKDIQALIFHYALTLTESNSLPQKLHAEPTKAGMRPDLVLGDDEVFLEVKLSKAHSGGYTQAVRSWVADVKKLQRYRSLWPESRCVFLGIDEAGHHSSPSSDNYFDPVAAGLRGRWSQLGSSVGYFLGEL
ncbi:MAG: hypothetical protein ACE5IJ_08260 [Thermoplasmata archaeon]